MTTIKDYIDRYKPTCLIELYVLSYTVGDELDHYVDRDINSIPDFVLESEVKVANVDVNLFAGKCTLYIYI